MRTGAALLLLSWPLAAAPASLPPPQDPNSHESFLIYLEDRDAHASGDLLEVYDFYLSRNPADARTAIERCRFIDYALLEDLGGEGAEGGTLEACVADLERRFPTDPAALLYRLEHASGEDAIALALAILEGERGGWSAEQIGVVYSRLAHTYASRAEVEKAAAAASSAMRLDPSVDLTLYVARARAAAGDREAAVRLLAARLRSDSDPRDLTAKVRLLVELEAFHEALAAIELLAQRSPGYVEAIDRARALEGVARVAEAREEYLEASTDDRFRPEALRRVFLLDLEGEDAEAALDSYDAYRELGFWTDPLLRYRLALSARFSSTPWRARDAPGALALLATGLLLLLLPALWIVPVHYRRAVRGDAPVVGGGRFGLRHVWYLSVLLLAAESLSAYLFLWGMGAASPAPSFAGIPVLPADLARYGLLSGVIFALGTFAILRRADLGSLFVGHWSVRKTLVTGLLAMAALNALLHLHLDAGGASASVDTLSTGIIRAIASEYGIPVAIGATVWLLPVAEEVAFRGIVLDGYGRYVSRSWANLLQALLFACAHESWALFPFYLVMGLVCGLLKMRSGALGAPIALHASNNLLFLVLLDAS